MVFSFNTGFLNCSHFTRQIVRFSSTSANIFKFDFQPKFTAQEQKRILETFNEANQHRLESLNIPKTKIKKLESYKSKKGPFRSLNEILEVDGLGIKLLEKLCEQIISDSSTISRTPTKSHCKDSSNVKRAKQFLAPPLPSNLGLTSAVGIHVAPMGVSWSKLSFQQNELLAWGYEDFLNLPKKMLPTDTFKVALNISKKLPVGDAYIFEGASSMGLQGQKQTTIASYTQQFELTSMLLAILNTSPTHACQAKETKVEATGDDDQNRVFFLRQKLPARLFKTLMGNECVSSTKIILELLENKADFSQPCSRILVEKRLKAEYDMQSAPHKELLGQALMLCIAFTDLCWKRNPVSLAAVAPGGR